MCVVSCDVWKAMHTRLQTTRAKLLQSYVSISRATAADAEPAITSSYFPSKCENRTSGRRELQVADTDVGDSLWSANVVPLACSTCRIDFWLEVGNTRDWV